MRAGAAGQRGVRGGTTRSARRCPALPCPAPPRPGLASAPGSSEGRGAAAEGRGEGAQQPRGAGVGSYERLRRAASEPGSHLRPALRPLPAAVGSVRPGPRPRCPAEAWLPGLPRLGCEGAGSGLVLEVGADW